MGRWEAHACARSLSRTWTTVACSRRARMRTEGTLAHNCPMASGMSTPTQLNCHFKGPNTCDEYDEQDEYNKYQKVTNMIKMIKMIKIQATQLTANSPCSFRCSRIANTVMYGSDNCNQQAASGRGRQRAHTSAQLLTREIHAAGGAVHMPGTAAATRVTESYVPWAPPCTAAETPTVPAIAWARRSGVTTPTDRPAGTQEPTQ